ncbi:MAG: hypothetical protein ACXVCY_16835 [Pseudobdellovibrionaceae bacterium]
MKIISRANSYSKMAIAVSLLIGTQAGAAAQEIDWSNQAKCNVMFATGTPDSDINIDVSEQSKLIEMPKIKNEDGSESDIRSGTEVFNVDDFQVKITTGFSISPTNGPLFTDTIEFSKGNKILSSTSQFNGAKTVLGSAYFISTNLMIRNPEIQSELAKLPANLRGNSINKVAKELYPDAKHAVYSVSVSCSTSNIKQIKVD